MSRTKLFPRPRRLLALGVVAVVAALFGATPSISDEVPAGTGDRETIQSVISDQIAAFGRDDGVAAFSHAAPGIQRLFETSERFMAMVKRDYMAVYRPRRVTFVELAIIDGALVQKVHLVGPDGVPVTAAYKMVRQPSGEWRIGGVILFRAGNDAI